MKFLLDENISPKTAKLLKKLGYDAKTIEDFNMLGCENGEVINLAMKENRIIVTLDSLFSYRFYFLNRGKIGIVLLKLDDLSVENVNEVLVCFLDSIRKKNKTIGKNLVILKKSGYKIIK